MIDALPPGAIGSAVTETKASTPRKTCKARSAGCVRYRPLRQALMYQGTLISTIRLLPCSNSSAFRSSAR